MARARNIKPGFYKNYKLADLGPHAQLLFAGLWGLADREGRLEDKPRLIKAEIFPYYDCDVNGVLTELERECFISRYEVEGQAVIQVMNFRKHQTPHNTEKASTLPVKPAANPHECSTSDIHCELTVDTQKSNDGKTPDSLIHRFTDSLIPDSPKKNSPPADAAGPAAPKISPKARLLEAGVSEQTATDWLALRKAKKAPVTQTVVTKIWFEAEKAGLTMEAALALCCARGWQGFEAKWVLQPSGAPPRPAPAPSRHSNFENLDYSEGIENGRIT